MLKGAVAPPFTRNVSGVREAEDRSDFARNWSGVNSISGDQMDADKDGSPSITVPKVFTAASLAWRTMPESSTTKAGHAA